MTQEILFTKENGELEEKDEETLYSLRFGDDREYHCVMYAPEIA